MFLAPFLTLFLTPFIIRTAQQVLAAPSRSLARGACPSTVAATWYVSWHSSDFTLQDVSWSKYTWVIYAFATTTPDSSVLGLADSDMTLLPQFVETAHQYGVNALLSVGGWGGSQYFSSAVATDANRTAFAQAVMNLVTQYSLDGIEFDWEYPGKQGIGCNVIFQDDTANFLLFLQKLRSMDGAQDIIVSAAVTDVPFIGSDGNPMSDISDFAKVLDYIEVMNYDDWGEWDTTVGPNAPLNDTCAASPQGSAVSAVDAWPGAGFPINKMILGVASYGHSFHPAGDKWDSTASGVDVCGNPNVVGGIFHFWSLIDGGFLTPDGTSALGIDYTYDTCSQTNATTEVMVSYDNAASFAIKGQFITDMGLAGFAMWEAGGGSNDILLDAIRFGVGTDHDG
ncbi:chitinase [Russula dissimulans]|nr:chitinase [Russula dissimulans]